MDTWEQLFERVLVPVTGLLGVVYAAVGGPVPPALYPVLLGMIGYPIARAYDRRRRGYYPPRDDEAPPPAPPKGKRAPTR